MNTDLHKQGQTADNSSKELKGNVAVLDRGKTPADLQTEGDDGNDVGTNLDRYERAVERLQEGVHSERYGHPTYLGEKESTGFVAKVVTFFSGE